MSASSAPASPTRILLGDRPEAAAGLDNAASRSTSAGKLEDRLVFHAKLGTQGERVERIAALASELAPLVGADPDKAERAAHARQGRSRHRDGRRIPRAAGPDGPLLRGCAGRGPVGRRAIEEHYKPLGPTDRVPTDPVAIAVALADKLDTLVGFWAIDEKPTGSKDPYALRRAALGVIRLVLENRIRLMPGCARMALLASSMASAFATPGPMRPISARPTSPTTNANCCQR